MPNAKSGKAGSLVAPADPKDALDADKADPGEVDKLKAEQQQSKTGKYGSTPLNARKKGASGAGSDDPNKDDKKKKDSWIALQLVDEDKKPVPGVRYQITLPDQTTEEGTTGPDGSARVDGIEPGQ